MAATAARNRGPEMDNETLAFCMDVHELASGDEMMMKISVSPRTLKLFLFLRFLSVYYSLLNHTFMNSLFSIFSSLFTRSFSLL